jgi:hypothetical protein
MAAQATRTSSTTKRRVIRRPVKQLSQSTDPIFAAIEAHKAAYTAASNAISAMDKASKDFPKELRDRLASPDLFKNFWFADANSASAHAKRALEEVAKNLPPKTARRLKHLMRDAEAEIRSAFKRAQAAHERKQRKAGWFAIQQALDDAHDNDKRTFRQMLRTRPRTAEGWRAMGEYVRPFYERGEVDDYYDIGHDFVCKTLFGNIEKLARRAK